MKKRSRFESGPIGPPPARQQHRPPGAAPIPPGVMALFGQALALHQAGRLTEAEPLYAEVLRSHPRHFDSLHLLGVVHHQCGRYEEAVRQIDAALRQNPAAAAAHNNRGAACKELGRLPEALASYDKAIALKPDYVDALYNRGTVLKELGQNERALADFDKVIALKPDHAVALNNRGNTLKDLERFDEAVASYDRAVALRPDYAEAWHNRANALSALKRFEEAVASSDRALALRPDFAEAMNNRGNALKELRRFEEAVASYDRALALKPDYADAFNNRGTAFNQLKRFDRALADYDSAIALKPDNADAFFNRGVTFAELDRDADAVESYSRAIAIDPDHGGARYNRGAMLIGQWRLDEALADFDRALTRGADQPNLKGIRLHTRMHLCDWRNFDASCAELNADIAAGRAAIAPFQFLSCPSTPAAQRECARIFVRDKYPPYAEPVWRGERYGHERIRVAYLSADMNDHPVAHLTAGMFARHDRSRFEIFAISFGPDKPSEMRDRLKRSFDRFIDANPMSDQEVAGLLRDLEVDIAVDLNGFTDGSRPNVFAQRPVPVRVNYLGYAGTQEYCDYIIADRCVIPEGSRVHYAEQVVYLPESFMVNDGGRAISERVPSRAEAGLPERGFIFSCFNNTYKLTPDLFDVWMRLLREVDGSVLWLSKANASAQMNLRREAETRGVAGERLVFAPRVARNEDHLARVGLADLFLDTRYYNAHATAADALWAGVPVVTCPGATFAGRVAASLLGAVGLPELITTSLADYEALALRLARDPARLAALRRKLASNRRTFPLFDTDRFTRHIEAAYTTMWERAERSEPPESIAVSPIERTA
jgi:predicted O-linked N-acetylglucosamine transferase (SPINDLY family)